MNFQFGELKTILTWQLSKTLLHSLFFALVHPCEERRQLSIAALVLKADDGRGGREGGGGGEESGSLFLTVRITLLFCKVK